MEQEYLLEKDQVRVILKGSMHVEDAGILRGKLLEIIDQGQKNFLVDMSNLDYIDSTGLGVLVTIHKRALQKNGTVTIKGLKGAVQDLFDLTRLNKVFTII